MVLIDMSCVDGKIMDDVREKAEMAVLYKLAASAGKGGEVHGVYII